LIQPSDAGQEVDMPQAATTPDCRALAVRRFSRFYTRQIGVLHEGLLDSSFSLTEARVLYEIACRDHPTAAAIGRDLGLDAGYLSRILRRFEARGLVTKARSSHDSRRSDLLLTEGGRKAFALLDGRSQEEALTLLGGLPEQEQSRLVAAMETIEDLLAAGRTNHVPWTLRPHRPGDMGWIIHRHGELYAQEYGWDETFEALVAEIAASFIREFNPARERCWIAEQGGAIVGSVFVVRQSDDTAKLRLLYVEPWARGLGIGRRMVDECIRFARDAGYRRMTLWTNNVLVAARKIYVHAGFRLVKAERHRSFGHDLVGEQWDLEL
jgi:DNA-binding MarR family transcriptional regulator/GNAT superfamily N-acetyltransferase